MPHDDLPPFDDDLPSFSGDLRSASGSAEELVQDAIEPGERVIWAGRPDLEALTREARSRSGVAGLLKGVFSPLAVFLLFGIGWAYLNGWDLPTLLAMLSSMAEAQPVQVVVGPLVVVGFLGLIYGLHAWSARKFIQRAQTLTYAITDRRLLVLAGSEIEKAFSPDEVRNIQLRDRTEGFQDLILLRRSRNGNSRGELLMAREKRYVGFKALPDAERIRDLVERWREAHLTSAERNLTDFFDDGSPDHDSSDDSLSQARFSDEGPSGEGSSDDGSSIDGAHTLRGGRYGLSVTFPEEWRAQVRHRRKPYGTFFLDTKTWQPPDVPGDWNAVKIQGPFQTTVQIHVDAVTEPVTTFEKAQASTLSRWVTGEVVHSEPDLRRGRFRGWSVTRRRQTSSDPSDDDELDRPGFFRLTQLFDGVLQIAMVSHWPGASDTMASTVERIEAAVSVDDHGAAATVAAGDGGADRVTGGVVPVEPGSSLSTAMGCAGGLVRVARIGLGILILGIGVWAGFDQTTRAEAYGEALDRLARAFADGLPTLPADQVVDTYDGQLAYLQGDLRPPMVTDSLTGLTLPSWRMRRIVSAIEDPAASAPFSDTSIIADGLALGAWRLSPYAYGFGEAVQVPDDLLAQASLEEPWRTTDGYVVSEEHPDVRIRYRYHAVTPGPRSVIGMPEEGVLDLDDELAQAPLMVDGAVTPDAMVAAAMETSRPVQSQWMMWAWVGLMLMLRPLARPFALFRGYTEAPFLRRMLLGGAIAAGIVLVLAVLLSAS